MSLKSFYFGTHQRSVLSVFFNKIWGYFWTQKRYEITLETGLRLKSEKKGLQRAQRPFFLGLNTH